MRTRGLIMWVAGLLLFLFAAFIYEPSLDSSGGMFARRVVNLDLQQRQLMLAMAGLTLFLAGIVVQTLGELADARSGTDRDNSPPPGGAAVHKKPESPVEAELRALQGVRPGDDGAQV